MVRAGNMKRLILEMGTGNDLHGRDYTKAAVRAVQDAMHHSLLTLFRHVDAKPNDMVVDVTIGVQRPEAVDVAQVKAQLPYGSVSVKCIFGGLDIFDPEDGAHTVVASAGIEAYLHMPEGRFALVDSAASA